MIKNSSIYIGTVVHKRFKPKIHFFKYKVFSLLLDLSELFFLDQNLKFFSYNKFNIISFYDEDHGPRDGTSIKNWVIRNLQKSNISVKNIKIKIFCYPRIFGYVFNPLSVFFIYNKKSKLISILYEVKNTFGEQHTYIFKVNKEDNLIKHKCRKKLYVSPFIKMDCKYFFKILINKKKISIVINQYDNEGKLLYASQEGLRSKLNNKNLIKSYLKHPIMTIKVILAIHYEAFKLWTKGIKSVTKKIKIKNNITLEK